MNSVYNQFHENILFSFQINFLRRKSSNANVPSKLTKNTRIVVVLIIFQLIKVNILWCLPISKKR